MTGTKRHALLVAATMVAGVGLAGCQGAAGSLAGGSPDGMPIAIESIEGPPATVSTALASELAAAASDRRVDLADTPASARYRVRGYLSTETGPAGETTLAVVWDVFDAEKRRAKRLTGSRPLPSGASDPWSDLDRATLAKLAAESMDEIAVFLSEAKSNGPTLTADASAAPAGALGFAPE
jgi:hypothetical protein